MGLFPFAVFVGSISNPSIADVHVPGDPWPGANHWCPIATMHPRSATARSTRSILTLPSTTCPTQTSALARRLSRRDASGQGGLRVPECRPSPRWLGAARRVPRTKPLELRHSQQRQPIVVEQ